MYYTLAYIYKYLPIYIHDSLSYTNIDVEGAKELAQELEKNTKLLHLDVCRNYICTDGCIVLADAMQKNKTLLTLKYDIHIGLLWFDMVCCDVPAPTDNIHYIYLASLGSIDHR